MRGADVFLIQSCCAPVNDSIMEMLIMIDALKRSSANRITAVIPYFGMPGRTVKISRACRSQPNWWQTSLPPPARTAC